VHHHDWQMLELRSFPSTRETEFFHTFARASTLTWRGEQIIPRYNEVGVTKIACQVPPGAPGTVESGGVPAVEGRANFPTAWFSTRTKAYERLANGV
jgi:hypothetical protein